MKLTDTQKVLVERGVSIINSSRDLLERKIAGCDDCPKFHYDGRSMTVSDSLKRVEALKAALSGEVFAIYDEDSSLYGIGWADMEASLHTMPLETRDNRKIQGWHLPL